MKHLIIFFVSTLCSIFALVQKALPEDVTKSIQARTEYGYSPSIVVAKNKLGVILRNLLNSTK